MVSLHLVTGSTRSTLTGSCDECRGDCTPIYSILSVLTWTLGARGARARRRPLLRGASCAPRRRRRGRPAAVLGPGGAFPSRGRPCPCPCPCPSLSPGTRCGCRGRDRGSRGRLGPCPCPCPGETSAGLSAPIHGTAWHGMARHGHGMRGALVNDRLPRASRLDVMDWVGLIPTCCTVLKGSRKRCRRFDARGRARMSCISCHVWLKTSTALAKTHALTMP